MKVILLEDVPKTGRKDDIVDVAAGFGLNFLLPQGKAKMATPEAIAELEKTREAREASRKEEEATLMEHLDAVESPTFTLSVPTNEEGHLFGSIKREDILKAINDEYGISLPQSSISAPDHIKETGEYPITISVGEKEYTFTLVVKNQ